MFANGLHGCGNHLSFFLFAESFHVIHSLRFAMMISMARFWETMQNTVGQYKVQLGHRRDPKGVQ